jgi:hypothetical protein
VLIDTSSSTSNSQTKSGVSFPATVPILYSACGTVDHQAGTPQLDSSGNPTPGAPGAATVTSNICNMCIIFPYYYGKVDCSCTTITGPNITGLGTKVTCLASSGISVPSPGFNTGNCEKGFLAAPQSLGSQFEVVFGNSTGLSTNTDYPIPGDLWGSPFSVPVTVNGISNTYSVYLFNYGSATTQTFKFTI